MIRILIVEDDAHIAKLIQATLAMVGYESEICGDGNQAFVRIQEPQWDLILLDVMLPGLSGFDIMKKGGTPPSPVIFLTAMQEVMDKVTGLKLGAEDYIVKPFEPIELLARVEVALRRNKKEQICYRYGSLYVNVRQHICEREGKRVLLTPKEFEVLVFFLKHQNVAISREQLLSAVWGYGYEGETRTVDIHIAQLRKKAGLTGRLITLPKLGYRLEKME